MAEKRGGRVKKQKNREKNDDEWKERLKNEMMDNRLGGLIRW